MNYQFLFSLKGMLPCSFYLQETCKVYLKSIYIEDITRWREDMNFIFEWQNNILRTSAASE